MSSENDSGEKSHEPTQHKIDEARKKGDIAKSMDVAAAAAFVGLFLAVIASGQVALDQAGAVLTALLARADTLAPAALGPGGPGVTARIVLEMGGALSPLFVLPFAGAFLAILAQRAFVVAPDKLVPKFSRLSIISNAGQKFGPSGLVNFAKSLVKMVAVTWALFAYMQARQDEIIGVVRGSDRAVLALIGESIVALLSITCVVFIVIGAIDILWQAFDHARKLRMTQQEVRDEHKSTEGDPHHKAQRRQRHTDLVGSRGMEDVPGADVVIVNPTHYAVALKWDRAKGGAPECVAKGVDEVALTIRRIAEENKVPIHSDPPTARALYGTVEIGEEIDPDHYQAVAAAIRFAEQMRVKARAGR